MPDTWTLRCESARKPQNQESSFRPILIIRVLRLDNWDSWWCPQGRFTGIHVKSNSSRCHLAKYHLDEFYGIHLPLCECSISIRAHVCQMLIRNGSFCSQHLQSSIFTINVLMFFWILPCVISLSPSLQHVYQHRYWNGASFFLPIKAKANRIFDQTASANGSCKRRLDIQRSTCVEHLGISRAPIANIIIF